MVTIIKNNEKFTPYVFYTSFLSDVAKYISENKDIEFKLFENGDKLIFDSTYQIEPISIPILLSLIEQLSKYFNKPITLALFNNSATEKVLHFLYKSDFFKVSGDGNKLYYPDGKNLLNFNEIYLGSLSTNNLRPEHKVRCYSLNKKKSVEHFQNDDEIRDFLISENTYLVKEHFQELLSDNANTLFKSNFYVSILAELITNGVLHSKSNAFALMFVNKFSTKFSISDNGIGFESSLASKNDNFIYQKGVLKSKIEDIKILNLNEKFIKNLNNIFETLYYSSLKDRHGLFDLMISVVLDSNGYFRIHSDNCQIIISARLQNHLIDLQNLRTQLFDFHKSIRYNNIKDERYDTKMIELKNQILDCFIQLYLDVCKKYNDDYKYSSIRFFNVKFRGVHIEVEIPNN